MRQNGKFTTIWPNAFLFLFAMHYQCSQIPHEHLQSFDNHFDQETECDTNLTVSQPEIMKMKLKRIG